MSKQPLEFSNFCVKTAVGIQCHLGFPPAFNCSSALFVKKYIYIVENFSKILLRIRHLWRRRLVKRVYIKLEPTNKTRPYFRSRTAAFHSACWPWRWNFYSRTSSWFRTTHRYLPLNYYFVSHSLSVFLFTGFTHETFRCIYASHEPPLIFTAFHNRQKTTYVTTINYNPRRHL